MVSSNDSSRRTRTRSGGRSAARVYSPPGEKSAAGRFQVRQHTLQDVRPADAQVAHQSGSAAAAVPCPSLSLIVRRHPAAGVGASVLAGGAGARPGVRQTRGRPRRRIRVQQLAGLADAQVARQPLVAGREDPDVVRPRA